MATSGNLARDIEQWLHKRVADPRAKEPIRAVELRQHKVSGGAEVVRSYEISNRDVALNPLALEIVQDAVDDAEGLRGLQRYGLYAFYGTSEVPTGGRKLFNIQSDDGMDVGDMEGSEPPTPEGMLAQTQRHLESVMRLQVASTSQQINALMRQNERLNDRIERMEGQHFRAIEVTEELLSLKQDRDLKATSAERSEARKDQALKTMMQFAPHLVRAITKPAELGAGGVPLPPDLTSPPPTAVPNAPAPTGPHRSHAVLINEVVEAAKGDGGVSTDAQIAALSQLVDMLGKNEERLLQIANVLEPEEILLFMSLFKVNKNGRARGVPLDAQAEVRS